MYVARQFDLLDATRTRSRFRFGPRQTGKSMLIRQTLPAGTR
jgi:hypothetical protein